MRWRHALLPHPMLFSRSLSHHVITRSELGVRGMPNFAYERLLKTPLYL